MLAKLFGISGATATGASNAEQQPDSNSENLNANACEFLVINSGLKEKPLGDEDWILVEMLIEDQAASPRQAPQGLDTSLSELELKSSSVPGSGTGTPQPWNITPPACFDGLATGVLATSNFENLLIEHASASVYDPSPHEITELCPRRPLTLADFLPLSLLNGSAATAADINRQQSVELAMKAKALSSRKLERSNRVAGRDESGSRRRKKRQTKCPSGRSNDRKCQ